MGLLDRFRRFGNDVSGDIHPDGVGELRVGDARLDDWEVVKDFDDLETARAFHQALTDAGIQAEITSDYEVNQYGRGDISLRVPPGKWSEANELLDVEP
jgi:hypothetical protein